MAACDAALLLTLLLATALGACSLVLALCGAWHVAGGAAGVARRARAAGEGLAAKAAALPSAGRLASRAAEVRGSGRIAAGEVPFAPHGRTAVGEASSAPYGRTVAGAASASSRTARGPLARLSGHFARSAERKRQEELRAGMPEMLRLMCIALDSGCSLSQALSHAARNCTGPLASELERAVWDMEAGQGFDEAMEKLRCRTGGPEFSYLSVALEIQHQTGSSLSEVLASVSQSLADVAELEESLATCTAQGRLSAKVVSIMPFALLAVLSLISPGYVSAFFESALGIVMLAVAVLLEAAGVLLVRRALAVDVSSGAIGAGA